MTITMTFSNVGQIQPQSKRRPFIRHVRVYVT
ncbi:hypothetical protein T05_3739 [Trichinella murrelli]|uniref:Uncharacterized protein n=1 Tax=Trichinella murrelli TaxID=144512 RepID=A0A0V0T4A7_9BILA|nr:hypothetical protein T05_3739 [Trichinella murrelli]